MMQNAARTAAVIDNVLRYTLPNEDEGEIGLDDIICVVSETDHQPQCAVLSLEHPSNRSDGCSQRLVKTIIPFLPEGLISFLTEIPDYLRREEPVQVVISTGSGTGTAQAVFQNIVGPLVTYLGIDHRVHETKSAQTITELSRALFLDRACAGIAQTIILLSGDGGLIDIVDVFYKTNRSIQVAPDIALIPCGTGNAMASSIGFRAGPASGLKGLLRGKPSPVPIFAATLSPNSQLVFDEGRQRAPIDDQAQTPFHTIYGAVVASWGLHAALVADSDTSEYRKFGPERFKMAAQELLHPSDGTEPHRFSGKITLATIDSPSGRLRQQTMHEKRHMYVLATLVPRLEKDFLISPDSEPLDKRMRFLRFGPLPAEDAKRLMTLAYQGGRHVREQGVTYTEVERIRIDFEEEQERWRRVCIDGKIIVVDEGGWMELGKEPWQLLNVIKL